MGDMNTSHVPLAGSDATTHDRLCARRSATSCAVARRVFLADIAAHELAADDPLPEFVMLLPAGEFCGRDGRGPYRLDWPAVMQAFKQGAVDLPIDYDHQTLDSSEKKGPVPAAGWIHAVENRGGQLWAHVSWTARAAELIRAREYRYLSPVFRHDDGGNVVKLEGAGLTHYPNLDLAPVANANAAHETLTGGNTVTKDIKQAEPTSPEPEQTAHAQGESAPAAQTVDPTQWVPMAQFRKVADELSGLREQMKREAAEAAVANAIEAGKLAPAMKDWASGYALADPDGFATYCAAAPAMLTGESLQRVACNSRTGDDLTEEDVVACALLNIDRAAFAEHKARTA